MWKLVLNFYTNRYKFFLNCSFVLSDLKMHLKTAFIHASGENITLSLKTFLAFKSSTKLFNRLTVGTGYRLTFSMK